MIDEILGKVSAYAYAVEKGYTGTETQFAYDLAHAADYASTAGAAAENASESEENAKDSEEAAALSEGNAKTYSDNAHADAAAALEAKTQAIAAKNDAVSAKGNAENFASIAEIAKQNASQSEQNASQSAENASDDAEAASNSASSASANSLKSEGFAVGEQNGVPVESGSPYYENNAKYYCEEASAQLGLVTAEGTRQIGLVTDEGTAQKNAVQEKGEQTLESIPEDYTTLRNDVSSLKSDIEDIETDFNFSVGLNLIDFSKILNGYELTNTTGNIRAASGWYVTDWIEVKPNTTYTVSGVSSYYHAEVDDTKTTHTGGSSSTATFTTGANTKYVRFNSEYSGYTTPQLEEGSVATAYVPYSYSSQWKKNISDMLTESNNIFSANESEKGKIINTSTGALTPNSSYWTTGFMPVSASEYESIISNHSTFREAYYASDKSFISYSTSHQPFVLPANTEYVRFSFTESAFPYAERDSLFVVPYGTNEAFKNRNIVNNDKLTVIDSDIFYIGKTDFTESASYTIKAGQKRAQTMIFACEAYYDGTAAPTIRFRMPYRNNVAKPNFYESQTYAIKNTVEYKRQEWRVPAFPSGALNLFMEITVPEGVTLHVKEISNRFDDIAPSPFPPYRLNAHLSGGNVYPGNTLKGFETAASLKYPCCVAVPKRTSDGIWVCFHDDANVGNTLRLPDGSTLPSADASKAISDFTYEQLLTYDAGIRLNVFYGGMKVPTLASFFELCMKSGMHPMLSIHPIPSASEYAEIKALAEKYHVLETLNVKMAGSTSNIADAYAVFGDAIESYAFDVSTDIDVASDMVALDLTLDHARLGIEYYNSVINQTKITNALNNGLFVACFIQYGTAARYDELLEMGVSEITDDNNNSYGLSW